MSERDERAGAGRVRTLRVVPDTYDHDEAVMVAVGRAAVDRPAAARAAGLWPHAAYTRG